MRGAGSRRQPSSQLVRRPKNCTERYPVRARVHLPLSLGMPQPVLDSDPGPNSHPHPRAKRLQSARNCGPEVVARTQRSGSGERDSFYSQLTRRPRDSPKPPAGKQARSETGESETAVCFSPRSLTNLPNWRRPSSPLGAARAFTGWGRARGLPAPLAPPGPHVTSRNVAWEFPRRHAPSSSSPGGVRRCSQGRSGVGEQSHHCGR